MNDAVKKASLFLFAVFVVVYLNVFTQKNAEAGLTNPHFIGMFSDNAERIAEIERRDAVFRNTISQTGDASWYGDSWWRHKVWHTYSEEIFRPDEVSCAHKTLPMHSIIKVTDRKTHSFVICRVNDRGPFWPGRIVDLSEGAAKKIGLIDKNGKSDGVAAVLIEVLRYGPARPVEFARRDK